MYKELFKEINDTYNKKFVPIVDNFASKVQILREISRTSSYEAFLQNHKQTVEDLRRDKFDEPWSKYIRTTVHIPIPDRLGDLRMHYFGATGRWDVKTTYFYDSKRTLLTTEVLKFAMLAMAVKDYTCMLDREEMVSYLALLALKHSCLFIQNDVKVERQIVQIDGSSKPQVTWYFVKPELALKVADVVFESYANTPNQMFTFKDYNGYTHYVFLDDLRKAKANNPFAREKKVTRERLEEVFKEVTTEITFEELTKLFNEKYGTDVSVHDMTTKFSKSYKDLKKKVKYKGKSSK